MGKNVGFLVRAAALTEIRNHVGIKDIGVQVFDRFPRVVEVPYVRAVRIPDIIKTTISTGTTERIVSIVFEVVSYPYDEGEEDATPTADAITEDVIEALETAFTLTGYGIPSDGQNVRVGDWGVIEGKDGEDLHFNTVQLEVQTLASE